MIIYTSGFLQGENEKSADPRNRKLSRALPINLDVGKNLPTWCYPEITGCQGCPGLVDRNDGMDHMQDGILADILDVAQGDIPADMRLAEPTAAVALDCNAAVGHTVRLLRLAFQRSCLAQGPRRWIDSLTWGVTSRIENFAIWQHSAFILQQVQCQLTAT